MSQNANKNLSNLLLFIAIIAMMFIAAIVSKNARAAYDPHDGSQYSCNEIAANAAYAKRNHFDLVYLSAKKEYITYCSDTPAMSQYRAKELELNSLKGVSDAHE